MKIVKMKSNYYYLLFLDEEKNEQRFTNKNWCNLKIFHQKGHKFILDVEQLIKLKFTIFLFLNTHQIHYICSFLN